jgi:hypothetical protein
MKEYPSSLVAPQRMQGKYVIKTGLSKSRQDVLRHFSILVQSSDTLIIKWPSKDTIRECGPVFWSRLRRVVRLRVATENLVSAHKRGLLINEKFNKTKS